MEFCACGKSLPTKPLQPTNVHEQVEKEAWREVGQNPVWRAIDFDAEKTKGDARNLQAKRSVLRPVFWGRLDFLGDRKTTLFLASSLTIDLR